MLDVIAGAAKLAAPLIKAVESASKSEIAKFKGTVAALDKPLRFDIKDLEKTVDGTDRSFQLKLKNLDKSLHNQEGSNTKETGAKKNDLNSNNINETQKKETSKIERMETQIVIQFRFPDGLDAKGKKEFIRQLKGQERGLNSQSIAENMENRKKYEQNGRDLAEGNKAQQYAREKALQSRIESNQKKGMSYSEAKAEATEWIKTQNALHNPDQIAGGDPAKVSRMGDANINKSIGRQWRSRVSQLDSAVKEYASGKSIEELEHIKLNVKLEVA